MCQCQAALPDQPGSQVIASRVSVGASRASRLLRVLIAGLEFENDRCKRRAQCGKPTEENNTGSCSLSLSLSFCCVLPLFLPVPVTKCLRELIPPCGSCRRLREAEAEALQSEDA